MGNQIARMTYAWRAGLWYLNARTKYTRLGFEAASQNFDADALDVDLAGKTYVVTGANSGIGFCTAKALAARGGKVYMCLLNVGRLTTTGFSLPPCIQVGQTLTQLRMLCLSSTSSKKNLFEQLTREQIL